MAPTGAFAVLRAGFGAFRAEFDRRLLFLLRFLLHFLLQLAEHLRRDHCADIQIAPPYIADAPAGLAGGGNAPFEK